MGISLGATVAAWIEENLVHGEGDYFGEPFTLEDWQKDFLKRLYALDPDTKRRLVRRALLVLPKGCGKTELAAAICLAELAGPTTYQDGYALPRRAPNIPVAAASFEQADRLFGAARVMAEEGKLSPILEVYDTEIMLKDKPGRLFRVAAQAGTNDGGLPTCFAADEIHEWSGSKARVHLVIANSLAKRADGLELNITTPDDAAPDSLLGNLKAYGDKVNSGEVDDPSFVFVHHTPSQETDLDDPEALRKAIREATPASWLDVERIAQRYEVDRIPEHEFRRYHLAQFVKASGAWLPTGAWDVLSGAEMPSDGSKVVLAFDGSYKGDSTALVGSTLDGELFVIEAWENPGDDKWRTPRSEVKARIQESMKRWKVLELCPDPFGWFDEVEEWEETYGEVVVRFETNQRKRMAAACNRFYTGVTAGHLRHDGDARLARHLFNVVTKETPSGVIITKEHPDSPRKIDLAVAAVIAYDRAMWHAGRTESVPEVVLI